MNEHLHVKLLYWVFWKLSIPLEVLSSIIFYRSFSQGFHTSSVITSPAYFDHLFHERKRKMYFMRKLMFLEMLASSSWLLPPLQDIAFQSILKLFSLLLFERQQVKLKGCPFALILLKLAFPKRERTSAKTGTNLSTVFIFILSLLQMLKGRCLTGKTAQL